MTENNQPVCKVCNHEHSTIYVCCPRCQHFNAMLSHREKTLPNKFFLKCRDCGYVTMVTNQ
jgi:translation initiation factor 2 beta subunit (eIF-2beta)/eIF-5